MESLQIGTLLIDRSTSIPQYKLKTYKRKVEKPGKVMDFSNFSPFAVVKGHVDSNGVSGYPLGMFVLMQNLGM